MKYYFMEVWSDYRNPATFYHQLMEEQNHFSMAIKPNSDSLSNMRQFKSKQSGKVVKVFTNVGFWTEVIILALIPYPT